MIFYIYHFFDDDNIDKGLYRYTHRLIHPTRCKFFVERALYQELTPALNTNHYKPNSFRKKINNKHIGQSI